jgi:SAM-dependent methyltransferase
MIKTILGLFKSGNSDEPLIETVLIPETALATPTPDPKPPFRNVAELEAFLRSIDTADAHSRAYLEEHRARIVRTLSVTPPAPPPDRGPSRVLELGAYMHMTPALHCVLGYIEVRGAYFGKLGKSDRKTTTVGGKQVFECMVDQFDAEKDIYPYPDKHFQTVLACEIFEHFLHDPMHMLLECRRVLTDDGCLVLTTPNVASFTAVARVLLRTKNPQLYSHYPDPRGEFADSEIPHVREYSPDELVQVLNCAGFEVDSLFTEVPRNYNSYMWVEDFLRKNHYPADLRGEQMYCVARRKPDAAITRYPSFLYEV